MCHPAHLAPRQPLLPKGNQLGDAVATVGVGEHQDRQQRQRDRERRRDQLHAQPQSVAV